MEWVKCSDRMPISNDDVFVYKTVEVLVTDGDTVTAMECNAGCPFGDKNSFWCSFTNYGNMGPKNITHWMPLPKPPEDL